MRCIRIKAQQISPVIMQWCWVCGFTMQLCVRLLHLRLWFRRNRILGIETCFFALGHLLPQGCFFGPFCRIGSSIYGGQMLKIFGLIVVGHVT